MVSAVMTEGLSYDGKAWWHWYYVSGSYDGTEERVFKGACEAVEGPIYSHSSFIITIITSAVGNTCHAACPDWAWKVKSYGKFADFYGEVRQYQVVAIQSHQREDTFPIQHTVFLHSSICHTACLFPCHAFCFLEMLTDLKSYIMKFVKGHFQSHQCLLENSNPAFKALELFLVTVLFQFLGNWNRVGWGKLLKDRVET